MPVPSSTPAAGTRHRPQRMDVTRARADGGVVQRDAAGRRPDREAADVRRHRRRQSLVAVDERGGRQRGRRPDLVVDEIGARRDRLQAAAFGRSCRRVDARGAGTRTRARHRVADLGRNRVDRAGERHAGRGGAGIRGIEQSLAAVHQRRRRRGRRRCARGSRCTRALRPAAPAARSDAPG